MEYYLIMHAYMLVQFLKYVLEGLAVAIAAYLISGTKKSGMKGVEILGLAMTAAATFAVLDVFAPSVAVSARQGTGFGLGAQQVGWPLGEGFAADYNEAFQHPKKAAAMEGFTEDLMEAQGEMTESEMPEITSTDNFVEQEMMPETEGFNPEADYEEGFYTRPDEEDGTEQFANYY